MKHFIRGKRIAFDTETTGVRVWQGDQPFAFSFTNEELESAYFEWPVDPYTRVVIPDERELEMMAELLLDPKVTIVMHNAKFDVRMMESFGVEMVDARGNVCCPIEETMFMAHACDSLEDSLGLKQLTSRYLGVSKEDQAYLQKLVVRLRNKAKKIGWNIAFTEKTKMTGEIEKKGEPNADYWIVQAAVREGQLDWFKPDDDRDACEKYATLDTHRTMLLARMFAEIMEELEVSHTYQEEMRLWPITYCIERRGIRLDRNMTIRQEADALQKFRDHLAEIEKVAWSGFNLDSPPDVAKLLYDEEYLNLPVRSRTPKSGKPATNVNAISLYAEECPTVQEIFKARAAHKGHGTFFKKYRELCVADPLSPGGFAIHTDFRQVGPATGRYSSATPNVQNVANALTTRSSEPIQARTAFGPRPGHRWYHWDYQQLEVVIFADVCDEPTMLAAIADGRDLHTECTNKAWGGVDNPAAIKAAIHSLELDGSGSAKKSPQVAALWRDMGVHYDRLHRLGPPEQRKLAEQWLSKYGWDIVVAEKAIKKKTSRAKAKMILFAKQFGGGPNAVKDLLDCSFDEAADFMNDYSIAFPRIDEYLRELSRQAKQDGFIINCYGRKLTVDPQKAYRAVNYMVQGSAADLVKRSMIRCWELLQEWGLDIHLVLTIHDELAFEASKEHAYRSKIMELGRTMADNEGHFRVPTPVELEVVTECWDKKRTPSWAKGVVHAAGYDPVTARARMGLEPV